MNTTIKNNIADNQQISAETLNNIATDIGKPDFSTFSDSEPFAVDMLNSITAELAGKGIIPDLKNEFSVTISEGKIVVSEGVGIFENGMKARLEAPVTLDFNGEGFLYIKYDAFANRITLNLAEDEEEGEFILNLAQITADGKIIDKRSFSQGKCAPVTENFRQTINVSGTFKIESEGYHLVESYPLAYSGFRGFTIENNREGMMYTLLFGYLEHSEKGDLCNWVTRNGSIYQGVEGFVIDTGSAGVKKVIAKLVINGKRLDLYISKQTENFPDTVIYDLNVRLF